jgi:hypothetical protein
MRQTAGVGRESGLVEAEGSRQLLAGAMRRQVSIAPPGHQGADGWPRCWIIASRIRHKAPGPRVPRLWQGAPGCRTCHEAGQIVMNCHSEVRMATTGGEQYSCANVAFTASSCAVPMAPPLERRRGRNQEFRQARMGLSAVGQLNTMSISMPTPQLSISFDRAVDIGLKAVLCTNRLSGKNMRSSAAPIPQRSI